MTEAKELHLFGDTGAQDGQVFLLGPLQWEFRKGERNVLNGFGGRRTRLRLRQGEESLLTSHRQKLLELFQGLREGGAAQGEHIGNVLRLSGAAGFLEHQIHAAGEHGVATEPLAPPNLLDGDVHAAAALDHGLVEPLVQPDQGQTLVGLHDRPLLIGHRIPGMVLANLVHGLGFALS